MQDLVVALISIPLLCVFGFIAYCELRALRCPCCNNKYDRDMGVPTTGAHRFFNAETMVMSPAPCQFCSVRCREEYEAPLHCAWCSQLVPRGRAILGRYLEDDGISDPIPPDLEGLHGLFAWMEHQDVTPTAKVWTFCSLKCRVAYEAARDVKETRTRSIVGE